MRIFLLLFFALMLSGCTSNLIQSDYKSESEFYNDLLELSENYEVQIQTNNLSMVLNEMTVNKDSVTGKIVAIESRDSSNFNTPKEIVSMVSLPTDEVKSFSIIKRTSGVLKGMGIGALVGGFFGGNFIQTGRSSNSGNHPETTKGIMIGTVTGAFMGIILGSIIGDDIVFSKMELSKDELFKENSVHKIGLKLGYHNGYNISSVPTKGHSLGGADGTGTPGFSITIYYNYELGKNISLNTETSFISAGSEEVYKLPDFTGRGVDKTKVFEAAPLIRINLAREGFTPYFILGPKFSYQFPESASAKENFYSDFNSRFGSEGISVKSNYKKFFWGGVIGAGFSTGKLFPYEILVEVKYCKDLSGRFEVDYFNPMLKYQSSDYSENIHQAEEIIINIGFAIF